MSPLTGYAAEKATLRQRLSRRRAVLKNRLERDTEIFQRIVMHKVYRSAKNIFIYISKTGEADTQMLIEHALGTGKKLFAPHCVTGNPDMDFYRFYSMGELQRGSFGVWQPEPDPAKLALRSDMEGALCIVPGMAFDRTGIRLGYGKGYYDRFLSENKLFRMGLCYEALLLDALPAEPHDIRMHAIVTDEQYRTIEVGKEDEYA